MPSFRSSCMKKKNECAAPFRHGTTHSPDFIETVLNLYDPEQFQDDEYDRDDEQNVNPIAGVKSGPAKITEQPEDYQNDYDDPKQRHVITPLKMICLYVAWLFNQVAVDLPFQQDEDAGRDGKDRHNDAQTRETQAEQCDQSIQDEPNGQ